MVHNKDNDLLITENAELDGFLDQAFDSLKICDVPARHALELGDRFILLLSHLLYLSRVLKL